MQFDERRSRRRGAWVFMAFAFTSLVFRNSKNDDRAEDFGKTLLFGADHHIPVQSPVMHIGNRNTLLQGDLNLKKFDVSNLFNEKNEIEEELFNAKSVIASLNKEKAELENQLRQLSITVKEQNDEIEAMMRRLYMLQQDLPPTSKKTVQNPIETSGSLGSAQVEASLQTMVQNLRTFISDASEKWNGYSADFPIAGSSLSSSYSKSRGDILQWLNDAALSVGESHKWLESSCQIVVANCDFLLLLVEMVIALLCVDFVLSSFLNWSQERIGRNDRTESASRYVYSQS